MNGLLGKRFLYAILMGISVSIVTVMLKFSAADYIKLVGFITGVFTIAQSYTDIKEQNGKEK